jgi:hypothetical protein
VLLNLPLGPLHGHVQVPTTTVPRGPVPSPGLAFRMPDTAELRASPRKAFAAYVPSLPISLDNRDPSEDYYTRQYQNPNGERGAHQSYGGFVRDRPLPRDVLPGEDWREQDMRSDVKQAVAAGLDGFILNLFNFAADTSQQQAKNNQRLLDAAAEVDPGFHIMLMPDMTAGLGRKDPSALAAGLAQLARSPAAYHLTDGRLVIAPFHAESHSARWWKEFLGLMRTDHGITVAFLPVFLDERAHLGEFAPFSYGLANWGTRNPVDNDAVGTDPDSPRGRIRAVHDQGIVWMQPVSAQDERPRSGAYQEADGTANLRNTWEIAINGGAELAMLATWNDYVEGTQFAPSAYQGWTALDISAYYLAWFKTGTPPQVLRDVLYLSHRLQPVRARPSFPETRLMELRGSTPAVDEVEVLAFLRRPGVVRITVAGQSTTCAADQGVSSCSAPLRPGRVSADLQQGGQVAAEVVSPYPVTAAPYVQNLMYVGVGSLGTRPRVPVRLGPVVRPTPT